VLNGMLWAIMRHKIGSKCVREPFWGSQTEYGWYRGSQEAAVKRCVCSDVACEIEDGAYGLFTQALISARFAF